MNSEPVVAREPLDEAISDEQIQQLIAERMAAGATSSQVEEIDGQKVLVTRYPPVDV